MTMIKEDELRKQLSNYITNLDLEIMTVDEVMINLGHIVDSHKAFKEDAKDKRKWSTIQ